MTLVLLPGMDGTGDLFAPFVEALGPAQEVQIVRYPGHAPLDYSALVDLVRQALPAEGPYVLLGESFSGPIAIRLAASRPPGLRGVVLCCTFARNPRPWLGWLRAVLPLLPSVAPPVRLLSRLLSGSQSTPAQMAALSEALGKVAPAVMRTRLRAVLSVDVTAELGSVAVPMLYLRAAQDRLVPPAASSAIAQVQPGLRIVEFSAPHLLLQASPVESARVVRDFLHETRSP